MQEVLFLALGALVLGATIMLVIAVRRWNNRERSLERVEALQALVAEVSQAAPAKQTRGGDWGLKLREQPRQPERATADPPSSPAAGQAARVTVTQHFVMTVSDGSGDTRQVTFQKKSNQP